MDTVIKKVSADVNIQLPSSVSLDAIILPERVTTDGVGLYPSSAIDLYKQFREDNIAVDYLQDKEHRKWVGRHGIPKPIIDFAIALASEASWEAIKLLIRKGSAKTQVRGKIARCVETSKGKVWEWYEIEGTADAVIDAIDKLPPPRSLK